MRPWGVMPSLILRESDPAHQSRSRRVGVFFAEGPGPTAGRWSQDRFDNGKSEGAVPIEEAGIWESGEMGSFGEGDQFPADEKACERCSRSVNSCPSS